MRPILLIFSALAFSAIFSCQEDTVEPDVFGKLFVEIILEADNSVVEGATISTNPPTNTLLTDSQGKVTFENIKVGTYSIRAEKSGLVTALESVTIFEGQSSTAVIKMQEMDEDNLPPSVPSNPFPSDETLEQPINMTLSWEASDPDGDSLTYDVYLFNSSQSPSTIIAEDIEENHFELTDLKYGTTYFWQVVVKDNATNPVFGEVWRFETEAFPTHPWVYAKVINGKYDIFCGKQVNDFYKLTTLPGSNFRPRVSPAGNKIAFLSNNFLNTNLYVMNKDGSSPALVPAPVPVDGHNKFELDFAWSPDGTKLLFMNENRLYKVNIDGSGFELFAERPNEEFVEVDWTEEGHKIAARVEGTYSWQSRILLYDALTGNMLQEIVPDLPGHIGGPAFSPDGQSILYTQDISGFESVVDPNRQLDSDIFIKNIQTGTVYNLSEPLFNVGKDTLTNDLDPRFSPDGSKVVFINTNNAVHDPSVFLMTIEGLGRLKLFSNSEMPDWQ